VKLDPHFHICAAREQGALHSAPYDRWVSPAGDVTAEFYRTDEGFLLRFPDQADFTIAGDLQNVRCAPVPEVARDAIETLYANSVRPVIGNHAGELNLHGSAVCIGDRALAIMGLSRRGKTTLAGAFAKAGHPFLTEDVLALTPQDGGWSVAPQRPVLRLFGDSAAILLGDSSGEHSDATKRELAASEALPASSSAAPLGAICILGPGDAHSTTMTPLGEAAALAQFMQHGFILDVDDKPRLHAHFARVAQLARAVPCFSLDYPREFSELSEVIRAVQHQLEQSDAAR